MPALLIGIVVGFIIGSCIPDEKRYSNMSPTDYVLFSQKYNQSPKRRIDIEDGYVPSWDEENIDIY
jgi:hypothetical protein